MINNNIVQSKVLFKEIYSYLNKKGILLDYWLDRLKFQLNDINNISINNVISELWEITKDFTIDYWTYSKKFLVRKYKWPSWFVFEFSIENITKPLFSLTLNTNYFWIKKRYITLNIYWISFQLHKIWLFNINKYIIPLLWNWLNEKITRIDIAYNFKLKDIDGFFNRIIKKYSGLNNMSLKYNESLQYSLYESAWRDKEWKVKYRLTSRFWFRLYNKTKEIKNHNLTKFYPQYHWLDIVRLEWVIWNKNVKSIIYDKSINTIEDLETVVRNKFLKL